MSSFRITNKYLQSQLGHAARAKGWDIATPFWTRSEDGQHNIARVGVVFLQHNTYYGWKLCQMANEGGGENILYSASTAREMDAYLRGVIMGGKQL